MTSSERFLHILISCCITIAVLLVLGSSALAIHLTIQNAKQHPSSKLGTLLGALPPQTFTLSYQGTTYATPSGSIIQEVPLPTPAPYSLTHELFSTAWRAIPLASPKPTYRIDEARAQSWISQLALGIEQPASPAAVLVTKNPKSPLEIFPGKTGIALDIQKTLQGMLATDWATASSSAIVTTTTGYTLTPEEIPQSQTRLDKLSKLQTTFLARTTPLKLTKQDIAAVIALPSGFHDDAIHAIAKRWSTSVSALPVEPELVIEGDVVKKFVPPADGLGIAVDQTVAAILEVLKQAEIGTPSATYNLAFTALPPKKTLKEVNSLGIEEMIGQGDSAYAHSIPGRIHNVALTASRINLTLIPPGSEFSFNKTLGDVSAKTGFKPAYVIKEGQTVLGDGGGVCQVSSTVFRAILASGLPVTARRGHSYRVSYYEQNSQPGFDATVYAPSPDLKFINDTSAPILIYTQADSKNLTMFVQFWGKSDGRKAVISNYKQWDASKAPPPVYQDDPSLPPGKLKQIDYAAPGLKTAFDYTVTYPDGQVKSQTFKTTYVPWRAVFLRGV